MKIHYFRDLFYGTVNNKPIIDHDDLPGTHGNNPRYCKACVKVIVAVEDHQSDDSKAFVGIAIRNPADQFNRKIGRAIATGRLTKLASYNVSVDKAELNKIIEESYQRDNYFALVDEWNYFVAPTSADLKDTQDLEKIGKAA